MHFKCAGYSTVFSYIFIKRTEEVGYFVVKPGAFSSEKSLV